MVGVLKCTAVASRALKLSGVGLTARRFDLCSSTSYVATARLNLTRSASLAIASAEGQDSHNYAALHCYTPAVYSTPSMYPSHILTLQPPLGEF